MPRWGLITLITVALIIAGLASLTVVTVRTSFPQTSGAVQVTPLDRPVLVLRDGFGVPQIYADTPEDLFAAQGFVHAQDRFFEMDVRRHLAAGRLAELLGESQVATDTFARTIGWRRIAEQELDLVSQRTRRYLESYAAGVNAYLETRTANELSLEYAMLGLRGLSYIPEQWTAADTLAWLKATTWDSSGGLANELELGVLAATIGVDRARSIQPRYDPEVFRPVVTHGAVRDRAFDPTAPPMPAGSAAAGTNPTGASPDWTSPIWTSSDGTLPAGPADEVVAAALRRTAMGQSGITPWDGVGEHGGSNAWVVSGDHTATGKPLLANDPHARTTIPGAFTQIGLHCRTVNSDCPFDVTGSSYSGVPGVMVGHNAHIAWGVADSDVDTQDLVVEQIRDGRVRRGDEWVPIVTRPERLDVAGGESRTIIVRETSHGPVLSDLPVPARSDGAGSLLDLRPGLDRRETAVALRWTELQPSLSVEAIFRINRATNFGEFRRAAELLEAPAQSLVYADTTGTIGYQLSGAIPIRRTGDGSIPTPGWDPAYDWGGTIPFAELPWAENPPEGNVVAANQQVVDGFPYPLGSEFSIGWRSQQIIHRLNETTEPITVADAESIFVDSKVRYADLIVPSLVAVTLDDEWIREGQQVLVDWDHASPPDSAGAFYFHLVMKHVVQLTFHDEIPEELRTSTGDRWYGVVADLLREPNSEWWDDKNTTVVEDRDAILAFALTHARRDATQIRSQDPAGWHWGAAHRLRLQHRALGGSGIVSMEALFNRGDIEVGGGVAVVRAWSFDDRQRDFDVTAGPAMKQLVDLNEFDNSRWVNLSGQSGHAYHPNYADQLPLIARNELRSWPFTRHRVEDTATQRLELLPGR